MGKLKKSLLISLAALFVAAIALFGVLNFHAAAADENVLPENTAYYTFVNQATETSSPWVWHADTNEWLGEEGVYTMTVEKPSAVLKLNVTGAGKIVFEWKLGSEYVTSAAKNQLHVVHHKQTDSQDVDVVPLQTKNNDETVKEWQKVEVNVEIGDTLTFTFTRNMDGGSYSPLPQAYVHGLKKPSLTDNATINVNVSGQGTVQGGEKPAAANLQLKVPIGQKFTVKAEPAQGNVFAYWTDKKGAIISCKPESSFYYTMGDVTANFVAESETVEVSLTFDDRLGKMYLLQNTSKANISECIEKGLPIEKDATVKIKIGTTIVLGVECFEDVLSTIDPNQHTSAVFGGWRDVITPLDITFLGTSNNTQAFSVDENGLNYTWKSGSTWYTKKMEAKFQEVAPVPKIFYTATIDSNAREKKELHDKENIKLNYKQLNDILFEIEQNGFEQNEKFALTINGEKGTIISDGEMCGFTLNGINENKNIVITPDYGEKYASTPFEFSISIVLDEGIEGIILDSSAAISVENDDVYPWYFDPSRNNGGYAFTSGISYLETLTVPSFSQLKFTVVGNGSLTFEYHIDGHATSNKPETNHNSWAAYNIGSKVYASKCTTGTTTGVDWRAYGGDGGGFNSTIATNLGYGNSKGSWDGSVTYNEPGIYKGESIPDSENAKAGEKYWYKVSISISGKQDNEQTAIYIAHAIGVSSYSSVANMTVRNVAFYKGDVNVKWASNNINGGEGNSLNKINVTGATEQGKIAAGTTLEFTAVPAQGYSFYCWKNGEDKVLSYDTTYKVTAGGGDLDIRGIFDLNKSYAVRIDDKFYKPDEIETALSEAASGKEVVVVDNVELANITVPAGVNLVIPFNRAGNSYAKGTPTTASNQISWVSDKYKKPVYTLTLTGTNTILGTLTVGGVLHYPDQSAQGHTSGAYSQLILNGDITVGGGGVMDVYGFVTGTGGITVESGGVLYQPFLILDYAGGSNTYDLFYLYQTPFKRYAMINIQCAKGYKINYGGELLGHASLYFLSSVTTLDTQFISFEGSVQVGSKSKSGTTTLINLKKDASVTGVYKAENFVASGGGNTANIGHTTLTISGGAKAGFMNFLDMVQTDEVAFSIPYNYSLVLKNGEYEIGYDYKLMPGASLAVESGAKLNLTAKLLVYDGLVQSKMSGKGYPTATELTKAGYSTNANFIVDGTFNVKNGATFLGVIQTNGTGKLSIEQGANLSVEENVVDGGTTDYDCNLTEFFGFTARVYDSAHGKMAELKPGNYTSVTCEAWTLPALDLKYENKDFGSSNAMKGIANCADPDNDGNCDYCKQPFVSGNTHAVEENKHHLHDNSNTFISAKTEVVEGLKGAWALTEHEHVYEWNYSDEEHPTDSEKIKTLTRQCTELGCKEHETHKLLYTVADLNLGDITFKNSAITEDDIKELLKAYYGADVESLIQSISIDGEKINFGQNYSVTVTLNEDSFFWADGAAKDSFVFKWNIKEAEITEITLSSAEKPYDGEAITKEIVTKVVAGELQLSAGDYDVNITLKKGGENSANVGVYTVTVTGQNNYKGTISKDFTIKQVEITIDVKDDLTATYAGKAKAPEIPAEAYEQTGKTVGNDSITVNVKYKNDVNEWKAGESFALTATYKFSGISEANYKITVNDGSLTVNKKPVTLKVGNKNSEYGAEHDKNWNIEGIEGFAGDFDEQTILGMVEISCEVTKESSATTYPITIKWKEGNGTFDNFDVTLNGGTYTISPAEYADVKFEGETKVTYDGNEHYLTVKAPVGADVTITYKLRDGEGDYSDKKPVNAGTYDVKAVVTSQNYNGGKPYEFTGTLTIDKASISEVTITGKYDYDGKEKTLQVTVKTANGLTLTANDYTVNCGNLKNAQEGISYSVTAKTDNYTGTASTTFSIAKKAATVKINNQSKVYDMTAPNLSQTEVTKEGFVDGEDIGLQLSLVTSATDVNDYRIKYEVTKANVANNYNITYCTSDGKTIDDSNYPKYSITRKQATITVGNLTSVYGEEVKTNYEYTSEGFLSDGYTPQLSYECSVVKGTAKGDYEITATVTNEHKNYDITVNKGKYQVTARAITITVNSGTSVYGDVIPAELAGYEITLGEKYGDDNLQVTLTRESGTDAGNYNITAECGNTNYSATIVQGKWTITQKPVTGIMVIVSDGTNDYSDSGDGVIHAKFGGQPLTISAGAPNPYQDLLVETSVTEITETGSYTVTARIVETNYSGEITVKIEVAPDLSIALERLAALKAQLSGEELTAEDFGVMKQINDLINGLAEEDRESDELNEYKELIESWNAAAGIDEEIITQANTLADEIISGIIAAISAAAAIAYVAIFGGKAI